MAYASGGGRPAGPPVGGATYEHKVETYEGGSTYVEAARRQIWEEETLRWLKPPAFLEKEHLNRKVFERLMTF
jgi:hypothetical protein